MTVHAWNTDALVVELANRSVSPDEQVYYLIYGWVLATIAGYASLTASNAGNSWWGVYEAVVLVVVTVIGIMKCYAQAGGQSSDSFVVDFTCLMFPVSLKVTLGVGIAYLLLRHGAIDLYLFLASSPQGEARDMLFVSTLIFLFSLAWPVLFFWRMASHFGKLRDLRTAS